MRCPKCGSDFETFTHENVEVNRCNDCGGIWFDAAEKKNLEQIEDAAIIDSGDRRVGKKYNEMRNINCPKCDVAMYRVADKTQFHIEYESCPACYGTFFDAGEFKDLNDLTVVERFKKMVDIWMAVR